MAGNSKNLVLLAGVFLTITACSGGGSGGAADVVLPPPPGPPPSNENIDDPTLTLADNDEVSPGDTLTLVWADEFDDSQLDPENWFFETGDGSQYGIPGWGNNELQYYLPNNASLENGLLTIEARAESSNGFDYTSARIHTRDRFAFRYGRIEARMRLPGGQGVWPAFWLLPQNDQYGGWAASGEIDIVEAVNLGGAGGNNIYGTIHYGGEWPNNVFSGEAFLVPANATTEFHTYAIEWDANEIRWYVDDVLYAMRNSWLSTGGVFPAPFDQHFYILLNVAVGGNFPGNPDDSTTFPVRMEVDWLRVYAGEP
jgi:beta-glucanase (GH16 family)